MIGGFEVLTVDGRTLHAFLGFEMQWDGKPGHP